MQYMNTLGYEISGEYKDGASWFSCKKCFRWLSYHMYSGIASHQQLGRHAHFIEMR